MVGSIFPEVYIDFAEKGSSSRREEQKKRSVFKIHEHFFATINAEIDPFSAKSI